MCSLLQPGTSCLSLTPKPSSCCPRIPRFDINLVFRNETMYNIQQPGQEAATDG